MVKLHRTLIEEAGGGPLAMLDTPFGFQANADDLTGKIQQYFSESVGSDVEVAQWRRRDDPVAGRERSLELLQRSSWAFAGPGSPTYALSQWFDTAVPEALIDLVGRDGTVIMGSAAAVTAGSWSVPVYEIYKVGEDPRWVPGLDLLGSITGIDAAVIPHYDNREGGRHDTRFCYLGQTRLDEMEALLPEGVGIFGVDEHTAVVVDVVDRRATVHGAGGLTLRSAGTDQVIPAGDTIALDDIEAILTGRGRKPRATHAPSESDGDRRATSPEDDGTATPGLAQTAQEAKARFDAALAAGDAEGALEAVLDVEDAIHAWSNDTLDSDDANAARRVLRSMLVALAGAASSGLGDPREVIAPVVEVALDARLRARAAKDFATGDAIRDGLLAAGIEVRDTPDGAAWDLRS